jgi:hypothetical protein
MATLEPLGGSNAAHSFAYWGEHADWLVALGQHRDSDDVDRSNWAVITEDFEQRFEGDDWTIERFSNWAVGWTEALLVKPGTPVAAAAQEWADRLERYPIADEEHHMMLEYDEQWCIRCDHGIRSQHPGDGFVCRKFRSESEADDIRYLWEKRRERRTA